MDIDAMRGPDLSSKEKVKLITSYHHHPTIQYG